MAVDLDKYTTSLQKKLMSDNILSLTINSNEILDFELGQSIVYRGHTYSLNRLPAIRKGEKYKYIYDVNLEGESYSLIDVLIKLNGSINFTIFGDISFFADLITDSMNQISGGWTSNVDVESDSKTLTFEKETCRQAINILQNEFGVEWKVQGKVIYFTKKIERQVGGIFEYSPENGVYQLKRVNNNTNATLTRCYGIGGNRNLPIDYRGGLNNLVFENRYIDNTTKFNKIVERAIEFPEIYPRFEGVISAVSVNYLELTVPSMDFDVNSYLNPGQLAKVVFKSGDLLGYEFEIESVNYSTKIIVLKPYTDSNGNVYPLAAAKPQVGDTMTFIGIHMPATYISNAEDELEIATQKYLDENSELNVAYNLTLSREKGQNLDVGDLIKIVDNEIGIDIIGRVNSLTIDNIYLPEKITIEVSKYINLSTAQNFSGKIQATNSTVKNLSSVTNEEIRKLNIKAKEISGSGVLSFNSRTGAVNLLKSDVEGVLTGLIASHTHNYQPSNAALSSIAGLTTAVDKMIYTTAANTYAVTALTSTARSLLDDTSTSAMRTTLGLAIGTNVQAYDADLSAIAALSGTSGLLRKTGTNAWTLDTISYQATIVAGTVNQYYRGDKTWQTLNDSHQHSDYVSKSAYGTNSFVGAYLIFTDGGSTNRDFISYNDTTNAFYFNADTSLVADSANAKIYALNGNSDNWNTAYSHSQDNSQAHSDYLINNGNDSTSGTITAAGLNVGAYAVYHAGNSNLSTVDWTSKVLYNYGGIRIQNENTFIAYDSASNNRIVIGADTTSSYIYGTYGSGGTRNIRINELGGNILIGSASDDGVNKLQVTGTGRFTSDLITNANLTVNGHAIVDDYLSVDGFLLKDSTDRTGLLEINRLGSTGYSGIQTKFSATALWSLMGHETVFGAYDDANADWIWYYVKNGSLDLRYNGSVKLATTNTGVEVTGDILPEASYTRSIGSSSIYYSAVYSKNMYMYPTSSTGGSTHGYWLKNYGQTDGGGLGAMHANNVFSYLYIGRAYDDHNIRMYLDGATELKYDNSTKLATNTGGVAITGHLTADSATLTGLFTSVGLSNSGDFTMSKDAALFNMAAGTTAAKPRFVIGEQFAYGFGMEWSASTTLDFLGFNNQLIGGASYADLGNVDITTNTWTFKDKVLINGQIAASAAALQVNGFMRTGNIYLHEGGQTPTTTALYLSNVSGNIQWNNNTMYHAGNSNSSSYNWAANTLTAQAISTGNVLPRTNNAYDVGSTSAQWRAMHSYNFYADNTHGSGFGFWSSDTYKIYMSSVASEPYGVTELSATGDYNMYFRMTGTGRGFVFYNLSDSATAAAQITGTGNLYVRGEATFYSTSDKRLKTNITSMDNGLDFIDKLRPITFQWNDIAKGLNTRKDDRINYGLIAQELEAIAPELIHSVYEKYKSIDYESMIPILIKAIQEINLKLKKYGLTN